LTNRDLNRIVNTLSLLVLEQSGRDLDQSRWGISIPLAHALVDTQLKSYVTLLKTNLEALVVDSNGGVELGRGGPFLGRLSDARNLLLQLGRLELGYAQPHLTKVVL